MLGCWLSLCGSWAVHGRLRVGNQKMEQEGKPKPQILSIHNMITLMYLYKIMYVCAYRNVKISMYWSAYLVWNQTFKSVSFYFSNNMLLWTEHHFWRQNLKFKSWLCVQQLDLFYKSFLLSFFPYPKTETILAMFWGSNELTHGSTF